MSTNQSSVKSIITHLIVAILAAVVGFFGAGIINPTEGTKSKEIESESDSFKEFRSGGYKFINPLLECDNFKHSSLKHTAKIENELLSYIESVKSSGKASLVSVYFRDLNNGPWTGINEDAAYSPASLLKVPIVIAALKRVEGEPGFLKKKIVFDIPPDAFALNIDDHVAIEKGKSYEVLDLIERTIIHSDNNAKNLLLRELGSDFINKVFKDLGIFNGQSSPEIIVSVKTYSTLFRLLYNATYLNREMSELALSILSQSAFKDALVAGVPADVMVAHKFGERGYMDSNIKQHHDCGIIYHSRTPYLLCVMTQGTEFATLSSIIADVSAIVYKNVDQN